MKSDESKGRPWVEGGSGRREVRRLLPQLPAEALAVARGIRQSSYRCQALLAVAAAQSSLEDALITLKESLVAAHEQDEPHLVVTLASAPLTRLLRIDGIAATAEAKLLLELAVAEPDGFRRLHALGSLFDSISEDAALRRLVSGPYLETVRDRQVWRFDDSERGRSAEGVIGRRHANFLMPYYPTEALAVARRIRHPWYRCQALAAVASGQPSREDALPKLKESLAAAHEQAEPNRIVTVASWPLKHLVRIDSRAAADEVTALLGVAASEPHGLRRLHALGSLFHCILADSALRGMVAGPYFETASKCHGWRSERTISGLIEAMAAFDPALAGALLATRIPNRFSKQAARVLAERAAVNES